MPRVESFEFVTRAGVRLPLDGTLMGWDFEVAPTFGEHVILYRSGAIHQWQGQGPRRFSYQCILREPGASDAFKNIEAALAAEPFGTLIDARFGHVNAFFTGPLKSSEVVDESISTKEFTVSFTETNLRTVPSDTPTSAAVAAGQASTALQGQVAAAALANMAAIVAQAQSVDQAVTAFQAVTSQAAFTQMDLQSALAQVQYAAQNLIGLLGLAVAQAYLVAQARLVVGRCLYSYNLAGAQQPPIVTRSVPERMSLPRFCVMLYGGGAAGIEDQIMALNRIPNPYALVPGVPLLLPDPGSVSLPSVAGGSVLQAVSS